MNNHIKELFYVVICYHLSASTFHCSSAYRRSRNVLIFEAVPCCCSSSKTSYKTQGHFVPEFGMLRLDTNDESHIPLGRPTSLLWWQKSHFTTFQTMPCTFGYSAGSSPGKGLTTVSSLWSAAPFLIDEERKGRENSTVSQNGGDPSGVAGHNFEFSSGRKSQNWLLPRIFSLRHHWAQFCVESKYHLGILGSWPMIWYRVSRSQLWTRAILRWLPRSSILRSHTSRSARGEHFVHPLQQEALLISEKNIVSYAEKRIISSGNKTGLLGQNV